MEDRVAMLSGATGGIGASVARALRAEGWQLSMGVRDPAADVPCGPRDLVVRHDAGAADEAGWAEATRARFGRIDAVIASAGLMVPDDVIDISDESLEAMWEINVRSPRRLVRAAWPDLVACGQGRVILLVSLSGRRVRSAAGGSYAVTKHAALALSHAIRHRGWPDGIRATAICPGRVNTAMARAITDAPPETMTRPEEVAALVTLALNMPNTASVAEMMVNCDLEDQY